MTAALVRPDQDLEEEGKGHLLEPGELLSLRRDEGELGVPLHKVNLSAP